EDAARLDNDGAVGSIKCADAVHAAHVDDDTVAALIRCCSTGEARIAALRNNRHIMLPAKRDQCGCFCRAGGESQAASLALIDAAPILEMRHHCLCRG